MTSDAAADYLRQVAGKGWGVGGARELKMTFDYGSTSTVSLPRTTTATTSATATTTTSANRGMGGFGASLMVDASSSSSGSAIMSAAAESGAPVGNSTRQCKICSERNLHGGIFPSNQRCNLPSNIPTLSIQVFPLSTIQSRSTLLHLWRKN